MKGNLAKREPEFMKQWEEYGLYKEMLKKREGKERYILHDGPPYANGNIHMGHVLNKVLKDIIVRYKSFKGYYTPYVPGWDCHGMPIEHKVTDNLGSKAKNMSKLEIRKECNDYAMKYLDIQRGQFKRMGITGDWENPYVTLDRDYEDKMVEIFWEMYKKGLVYKGLKPVYWCAKCETALAEAEVEYKDHSAPSVYVKFAVKDGSKAKAKPGNDASMVIWTTTPWTLPANVAIAVHPDYDYVLAEMDGNKYILAEGLLEEFMSKAGIKSHKVIKKYKGSDLENTICLHPFVERDSLVINASYVTLETGTGCVHIAPGHGHDDYVSSLKYKLPILTPVDSKGRFTSEFKMMEGKNVFSANGEIVELLKSKSALLASEEIQHSYPHCWRCKSPIIFRATNQWFISMEKDGFREKAAGEVKNVKWLNEWGEDRIRKMIETRPDWCISRQRSWGVPIFVFYCKKCEKSIVTEDSINRVHELIKKDGSDGWFRYSAVEILGKGFKCPHCGSEELEKENDIFDVWFDSGSSSLAVCEGRWKLDWPVDLYIEGSDQYRGWFQSSLLACVGTRGKAPYKSVISHGWVVDGQGRAMHKSLGNVIDPLKLIKKGGADLLRLWVASEDFKADQAVSDEIMARVTDSYRRIRNSFRYMLGNLHDFDKKDMVEYDKLLKLDKYALHKLQELCDKTEAYYEKFEFYKVYREYVQFCSIFLSSFYFDILKDRLYTFGKKSAGRLSGQTVLYKMFTKLSKLIAPVLAFTADEAWQFLPEGLKDVPHIQLGEWGDEKETKLPEEEIKKWNTLIESREKAMKSIEDKRNNGEIKHPYEAHINLKYGGEEAEKAFGFFTEEEIAEIFIVSEVKKTQDKGMKGTAVEVVKPGIPRCARCWRHVGSVGKNPARPELCERCVSNLD